MKKISKKFRKKFVMSKWKIFQSKKNRRAALARTPLKGAMIDARRSARDM